MESEIKLLALENTILKQELNELKNKVSATLFPGIQFSTNTSNTQHNSQPSKGWF